MSSILVVDDVAVCRELLAATLEAAGYLVISAPDATGAMKALTEHNPDLVILDLDMPGMDGLTLLKWIRGNRKWAKLPVMLLTGVQGRGQIRTAGELHVCEYLLKTDFDVARLLARVKKHLGSASVQEEAA